MAARPKSTENPSFLNEKTFSLTTDGPLWNVIRTMPEG